MDDQSSIAVRADCPRLMRATLWAAAAVASLVAGTLAAPAAAADPAAAPDREFASPPAARPEPAPGLQVHTFAVPLAVAALPPQPADAYIDPRQDILYKLEIELTKGQIYNPWTNGQDQVLLRSYHGSAVDPATPFLAPTISMRPGQTVRIALTNGLAPKDKDGKFIPQPPCMPVNMNTPHCFDDTNLHAHGLWVSPSGNSDNVLITIDPGVTFEYEYNVPSDHPAGTFWYHPHKHGSTALQVSSGMEGALIIRDDRAPTASTPGDLDILLTDPSGKSIEDKVIMFQQVQYACFDSAGKIQKTNGGQPWVCHPGQAGEIRTYDQFGPSNTWTSSGRFTSINGRVQPEITGLVAGRFERWRLIHGGVREAVNLQLRALDPKAPDFRRVKAVDQPAWMAKYCKGPLLPMFEAALDGLTRSEVRPVTESRLQPGYRADLVVQFPTAGRYCILDGATTALGSPSGEPEPQYLLAVAVVDPGAPAAGSAKDQLRDLMVAAAERNIADKAMQDQVVGDLNNDLKLTKFVWHKTIDTAEINTAPQELVFNIVTSPALKFLINGQSYDPDRIDREMTVGSVQEWRLTSLLASHPFHIHVNPFQVVSIVNAAGEDVTDPTKPTYDPDYAGVIGQWKDTLFVKQGDHVVIRTRYERYIGDYVLHCHILDHEDQGMMQNVRISLPDGAGGVSSMHMQ